MPDVGLCLYSVLLTEWTNDCQRVEKYSDERSGRRACPFNQQRPPISNLHTMARISGDRLYGAVDVFLKRDDISEESKRKLLVDNTARFYGL